MSRPGGPRVNGFDRLRPRAPEAEAQVARPGETRPDAEGKRALFSPAEGVPAGGSVSIECSRCGATTVLSPGQALRTLLPSLHLGVAFARRDGETQLGLTRRRYPSLLRCPACSRPSWSRLTLRV